MAGNNLTYRTIFIVAAGLVAGASFAAEGYGPKAETTEISVRAPGGPTFIHPSEVTKICDYSKRPPFRVYVVCMNIDANDIMATRNPSESDIKWFDGFLSELNSLRMQFDNLKISEDKAMAKAREIFKKYAPSRPSVANSARSSNVTRGGSADGRGPTSTVVPGVDRALQFAAQTQKARVIATPDEYGKFCNSYVPKTERLKSLCTIQGLEAARRKEQFDYLQQLTTTAIGQFWQLVDAIDAGALTSAQASDYGRIIVMEFKNNRERYLENVMRQSSDVIRRFGTPEAAPSRPAVREPSTTYCNQEPLLNSVTCNTY